MAEKYEIDDLDRKILRLLQEDARMPYLEIARKLIVSGGTIHQRMNKMIDQGIVKSTILQLNHAKLGLDVTVLLGIHLKSAKKITPVLEKLQSFPEVIEAHYTTGNFALLIKLCVPSIKDYHAFLTEKIQEIDEVSSTESFICLDSPIDREISI